MHVFELLLRHFGRRAHQYVARVAVHGEGDDLADVRLFGEQHDDPVHAGSYTRVRRRAELERIVERGELLLYHLFAVARDLERTLHDGGLVVPHRAGTQLHAVDDAVVLIGENVERIHGVERFQPALRHAERIVAEGEVALVVVLVHREVHDPAEAERVLFDEIQSDAQLRTQEAGLLCRVLFLRNEGDERAGREREPLGERVPAFRRELGYAARELAVVVSLEPIHILRAVKSALLGDAVYELARGGRAAHGDRFDRLACGEERRFAGQNVRDVLYDERIAQIRLVRAVVAHRVGVLYPAVRTFVHLAAAELGEYAGQHLFHDGEHVLLGGETHLGVQLIELAGTAVGARVLVAETRRYLEISVETARHEQLLVLLGRLRQRVELAGMQTGRHDEVPRSFRGGTREYGRGDLQESHVRHLASEPADHLGAEHYLVLHRGIAQIEETVLQPRILARLRGRRYLERQLLVTSAEHFHLFGLYLYHTRGHVGIGGAAPDDLALHRHRGFARYGTHECFHLLRRRDRLRAAVKVAQHEEYHRTEVARAGKPARQSDGFAYIVLAELSASMSPVSHILSLKAGVCPPFRIFLSSRPATGSPALRRCAPSATAACKASTALCLRLW